MSHRQIVLRTKQVARTLHPDITMVNICFPHAALFWQIAVTAVSLTRALLMRSCTCGRPQWSTRRWSGRGCMRWRWPSAGPSLGSSSLRWWSSGSSSRCRQTGRSSMTWLWIKYSFWLKRLLKVPWANFVISGSTAQTTSCQFRF